MQLFKDSENARALFGEAASAYGMLINDIAPHLFREEYKFEDLETYAEEMTDSNSNPQRAYRVYWDEVLCRAHIASVSSIVRACRWVESSVREFEARNIYGWAASTRSLMEAAADSLYSLQHIPLSLAKNHKRIQDALKGRASEFFISSEIEDFLIHYSHARKIAKGEDAPLSHRAKQSAEYINLLSDMKINGSKEMYRMLCNYVHPADMSVNIHFEKKDGGIFVFDPEFEDHYLSTCVEKYRDFLGGVLMAGFNPAIITLRVLHKFDCFSKISSLKKYDLSKIPFWRKIEVKLR